MGLTVSLKTSNGLKFNRQPSKKDIFYRQTSKNAE